MNMSRWTLLQSSARRGLLESSLRAKLHNSSARCKTEGQTGSRAGSRSGAGNGGQVLIQMNGQVDGQTIKWTVTAVGVWAESGSPWSLMYIPYQMIVLCGSCPLSVRFPSLHGVQVKELYPFFDLMFPISSWVWFPWFYFNMPMNTYSFDFLQ